MTNEGINDGIVYEASLDEVRRSKNERRNLKTSAAFKYGIVWHRTEATGGTNVPFDKPGEGVGISVCCALVQYEIACTGAIQMILPWQVSNKYETMWSDSV